MMFLFLFPKNRLMYIKIRAYPESKKELFIKESPDHFEVRVREKAEQNQANRRVLELVREHFGSVQVRIVSGHHSPSKIVSVDGAEARGVEMSKTKGAEDVRVRRRKK